MRPLRRTHGRTLQRCLPPGHPNLCLPGQEASIRNAEKVCQRVPGAVVDRAMQEVEARIAETDALRRKHVERAEYEAELSRRRYINVDPANRLVADSLEADWNHKLRILAEAQMQYDQQTQKQRLLIDSQAREQLLSLASDFPQIWNDPSVEPRERKRILRLLIEDVTLINGETIQVHVRLRGGATRSLTLDKPLPIAQIRKTKPEVVAEIDKLLDHYCDREVAEILNREGRRTWQNEPFNLKKIVRIRQAFNLKCRYTRLRARGLLTTKEISVQHDVKPTTINLWAREGRLQKHRYDNLRRCLYEPLEKRCDSQRPRRPTSQAADFQRCKGGMRCNMKHKPCDPDLGSDKAAPPRHSGRGHLETVD